MPRAGETESDVADSVGAVYEAAAGAGDWQDVGERLRRLLGARRSMLVLEDRSGTPRNVLMGADPAEAAYAAHFRTVDPYVQKARVDFAEARLEHIGRARIGADLVPDAAFLRSEYYYDFARRHERRHMLGGMLGLSQPAPIGFFRGDDSEPFGERDVRLLESVLPHFQRALELRARLSRSSEAEALTSAVLDSLPSAVAIVDADLKVRFANRSARQRLAAPGFGLACQRSGARAGAGVHLSARSRNDGSVLRRLVASAVSGGPGGLMRVADSDGSPVAVLVSRTPPGLAGETGDSRFEPTALVSIRPLERKSSPSIDMLCDFFGLSRAESEVAPALAGGATAKDMA
jgi:PAS domain-containing protein